MSDHGLRRYARGPMGWVYGGVLLIGLFLVANNIYQRYVNNEAASAYTQTANELLRSPIDGVTYALQIYQWEPSMSPLSRNGPLTTLNSYSFEMSAQGSDCDPRFDHVAVEFLSPAFLVVPEQPLTHAMKSLQQNYCSAGSHGTGAKYHWDILARQEGHHVVALHVTGFDKRGKEVGDNTLEIPVVVTNNPFTFSAIIGVLGAIGGLIGVLITVLDHFQRSPSDSTQAGP